MSEHDDVNFEVGRTIRVDAWNPSDPIPWEQFPEGEQVMFMRVGGWLEEDEDGDTVVTIKCEAATREEGRALADALLRLALKQGRA